MILAKIEYNRKILPDFWEFVKEEEVRLPSKTAILKHARAVKKEIAREGKFLTRISDGVGCDVVEYVIRYVEEK